MKIRLLAILLLISLNTFGQVADTIETKINDKGLLEGESNVVLSDKNSADIFNSSKDWISKRYRNPENVIQASIENKMIRFQAISHSVIGQFMGHRFGLEYVIQLDIMDEKLRFHAYDLNQIAEFAPYTSVSLEALLQFHQDMDSSKKYIKTKGQVDSELTKLLISLINNIKGKNEE